MRRIAACSLSVALALGVAACSSEPDVVSAEAPQSERDQYVCDQFALWRDGALPYGDEGDADVDTLSELANSVDASVGLRSRAATLAFSVQNEDADVSAAEAVEDFVDVCDL